MELGCCLQLLWLRVLMSRWFNVKIVDDFSSDELSANEEEEAEGEEKHVHARSDLQSVLPIPNELRSTRPADTAWISQQGTFERAFLDTEQLTIAVGTWNVAGRTPPPHLDLKDWLEWKSPADIYVVGFQEIVPLNVGNVCGVHDVKPANKWQALIRDMLNTLDVEVEWNSINEEALPLIADESCNDETIEDETLLVRPLLSSLSSVPGEKEERYVRVVSKQMVGIHISVWVRRKLCRFIHNLSVSCVGLGLMGCLGNKGSISVSMRLHQTSFCFICSHLTSGGKDGDEERRNWDATEILKRTHFPFKKDATTDNLTNIWGHDQIVWLGDLNYRLNLLDSEIRHLVAQEDWTSLFKKDQLKKQSKKGHIFEGWQEGTITFAPTYKYEFDSNDYTGENVIKLGGKQRSPAWSIAISLEWCFSDCQGIIICYVCACLCVGGVYAYLFFCVIKQTWKGDGSIKFRCDRVLWHGKGLQLLTYKRGESTFSDHRPVLAVFLVEVEVLNTKQQKPMIDQACKTEG